MGAAMASSRMVNAHHPAPRQAASSTHRRRPVAWAAATPASRLNVPTANAGPSVMNDAASRTKPGATATAATARSAPVGLSWRRARA